MSKLSRINRIQPLLRSMLDDYTSKQLWIFLILVFPIAVSGQNLISIPQNVRVLKTTRTEFEQIAERSKNLSSTYILNGMKIAAEFAPERCTWHGWDVDPGTMISFTAEPVAEIKVDTEKLISNGYELFINDTLSRIYWNDNEGQQIELGIRGELASVKFYPSLAHSSQRCVGFPLFTASSDLYSAEQFAVRKFREWDPGLLGDFAARLNNNDQLRGYVFIYYAKDNSSEALRFKTRIGKYLTRGLGLRSGRFEVIVGGLRDQNEIEAIYILNDQSPPLPRPKY